VTCEMNRLYKMTVETMR